MKMKSLTPLLDPAEFHIPPIANDPEYSRVLAELDCTIERLAQTTRRRDVAVARAAGNTAPGRTFMERAADLIAGGVIPAADPAAEIAACDEEAEILSAAVSSLRSRLSDIVAERSLEIARRFRADLAAAYRAQHEALLAFRDAHDVVVTLFGRLKSAGYEPESVLPSFAVWPVLQVLGTQQNGGQLWRLQKFIQDNDL
jgi:hypothetical protein